ncbi:MAG: hypothetical protein MJ174_05735 [Treponema sp.]|nr:hypothetical protein [Treponema sp.]
MDDFVEELKKDLISYERAYREMSFNEVFIQEERQYIWQEILRLRELIKILGDD